MKLKILIDSSSKYNLIAPKVIKNGNIKRNKEQIISLKNEYNDSVKSKVLNFIL